MKVLQVAHHFLPRHRAGVEVYTDRMARGLLARGTEVAVMATEDSGLRRRGSITERDDRGLRVFEVAHDRRLSEPRDTLGGEVEARSFAAVLDRFRPDLVHFQHLMYVGLDSGRLARARGLKTVLTLHEYWLLCARGGQFLREDLERCESAIPETCARCLPSFKFGRTPYEARVANGLESLRRLTGLDLFPRLKAWKERRAAPFPALTATADPELLRFVLERQARIGDLPGDFDAILAPSQFLRSKFLAAGWPEKRVQFWPYGVGKNENRPSKPLRPTGPLRVGFVGSLIPSKGVKVLVLAHRLLEKGKVQVSIHGSPKARPGYVAELLALADPNEVVFAGSHPPEASSEILSGLDVLVVPSIWFENSPIVISEAFAVGVPVVASRLGGMAELVRDGVDGRLFHPGSEQDLAKILSDLSTDRSELARLAKGIQPPRAIDDDVSALQDLYVRLLGA